MPDIPSSPAMALGSDPQAYLAAIITSSDDAIVSKDLDGTIRSWNAAAERIFGYAADEIVGRSILTIIPPDRHAEEAVIIGKLRRGERVEHFETVRRRKDGSLVEISVTVSPIRDEAGRVVGASKIARDVSELKRAARERERLYDLGKAMATLDEQALVQAITDVATELSGAQFGAFFYNVADSRGESYMLYTLSGVSREHFDKFPMPRNTEVFAPTFEGRGIVRSDDITGDPRYGRNAPRRGMPEGHLPVRSYLAVPVIARNGEVIGGLFFGHGKVGVFSEGDERVVASIAGHAAVALENARLHRQVSDTASRFQHLANGIPQLVWMADAEGRVYWYNERWADFTGPDWPEDCKLDWAPMVDPEERPRVVAGIRAAIAESRSWEDTYRLRRHDGSFRWILARARPVRGPGEKVASWFCTGTDVTDQVNLAREKEQLLGAERAARAEAERVGRMKDEFLATLSHELRTPLNAILGWSQIVRSSPEDAESLAEGLAAIERNAKAQTQLIEDLLDMSRIISGKLRLDVQHVDLTQVVEAAIDSVRPAADARGISLRRVLDPLHGVFVSGDPGRLQQVVWNLLSNAIKFTPKGGKVEVLLERVNSHVEITVADTGRGISPEFLPHVFERFRQSDASTTREHGGLGLGLAIVKQLVELHGGQVRAKSSGEGRGATFSISLPLIITRRESGSAEHPTSGAALQPDPTRVDLRGLKVLVVDDEPDARHLLRRVLADAGAEVLSAETVDEALSVLRSRLPDVVVSDIGMPAKDGYAFMREVRSLPPERGGRTPAIALTAFARSEDRTRAMMAGYHVHLAKPVEPRELLATVASLAGRTGVGAP